MIASYLIRLRLGRSVLREELPPVASRELALQLLDDIPDAAQYLESGLFRWSPLKGPAGLYNRKLYAFKGIHWFSITVLAPSLMLPAGNAINAALARRRCLSLNSIPLNLLEATCDENQSHWAGLSSYESLQRPLQSETELTLVFRSVLADELSASELLRPASLYECYYNTWKQFSRPPFSSAELGELNDCVRLRAHRLNGTRIRSSGEGQLLAYNGRLQLAIESDNSDVISLAHSLAAFSLYSGTGWSPERGLGLTRVVA